MFSEDPKGIRQSDRDLIQMVQRARMQHDSQATPSEIAAVYWIEAKCDAADCPGPTPRAGQWVMETTVAQVDTLWQIIRAATTSGKLGYKSKVSTAPRSGMKDDSRILVIRTYDSTNQHDVQRVRDALAELGLDGDWYYEPA